MATRTVTTDDLTRKDAEVSHKYRVTIEPVEATDSETEASNLFDLSPDSASALYEWVTELDSRGLATALRKSPVRLSGSSSGTSEDSETEVARAWLKAERPDIKVSDRGRLSETAWDAYRKAHNSK